MDDKFKLQKNSMTNFKVHLSPLKPALKSLNQVRSLNLLVAIPAKNNFNIDIQSSPYGLLSSPNELPSLKTIPKNFLLTQQPPNKEIESYKQFKITSKKKNIIEGTHLPISSPKIESPLKQDSSGAPCFPMIKNACSPHIQFEKTKRFESEETIQSFNSERRLKGIDTQDLKNSSLNRFITQQKDTEFSEEDEYGTMGLNPKRKQNRKKLLLHTENSYLILSTSQRQLDVSIERNKKEIKHLTQEMFMKSGKKIFRKSRLGSLNSLHSYPQKQHIPHNLPLSSLVNIKEAEFATHNLEIESQHKNEIKNKPHVNSSNKIELPTLANEKDPINNHNNLLDSPNSQGTLPQWLKNDKLINYKDKYSQTQRKQNLKQGLNKIDKTSHKKFKYERGTEDSLNFHLGAQNGSKNKDYQEYLGKEPTIKNILDQCQNLTQTVIDQFIIEVGTGIESELINSGSDSNNKQNDQINLWLKVKQYYLFCLGKVGEEWKKQQDLQQQALSDGPSAQEAAVAAAMLAVKQNKEEKYEDMDAALHSLVLSESSLERMKGVMRQVLSSNGIEMSFVNELVRCFSSYGKFIVATNNVKRIGIRNIQDFATKLVRTLIENQLIDKKLFFPSNYCYDSTPRENDSQWNDIKECNIPLNEPAMEQIKDFLVNLLNEHNETVLSQISEFRKIQELQSFEYFMLKCMMLDIMKEMHFEKSNIFILLEKMENIRILFYRNTKHSHNNFFFDNKENYPKIKNKIIKNKHLMEIIGEPHLDSFLKFLDSFLFGFREYPNLKKMLVLKNAPTREFFKKLGEEINQLIPLDVFRRDTLILDINHQIQKMEFFYFGATKNRPELDIQFHRVICQINVEEAVEKLSDWVEYQIIINQKPEEILEQDVLVNTKFLEFFLNFVFSCHGLAFSYYDLEVAFSYFKMNSSPAFHYWINRISKMLVQKYPSLNEQTLMTYLNQFMLFQP